MVIIFKCKRKEKKIAQSNESSKYKAKRVGEEARHVRQLGKQGKNKEIITIMKEN